MKKIIKLLPLILAVFLPNKLKILFYNKFFNWDIDVTAKIGLSFIAAKKVKMAAGTKICHLNVIKNLELLGMDEGAFIGNMNTITAIPLGSEIHFQDEEEREQTLIMGKGSSIVTKHFFDCNNKITIGEYTIVAGLGTGVFTHSINIEKNRQETAPIHIGDYCMVGAQSVLTRGASLPDCSVLAANSTLHKSYDETHTLYSGVPAVSVKKLDPDSLYFHRKLGFVD